MTRATSVRCFILGLLNRQPMSGYDIKCFLKSLSWLIGSPSFGSLYPALHSLLEDGLATMRALPRLDKPPRKTYTITEAGRDVLEEWINQPVAPDASLKDFVMRLILAGNLSRDGVVAHLQMRRTQVAAHHSTLTATTRIMDEGVDLREHLSLDYGLAIAIAELAWLDSKLDQLSQQALPAASKDIGIAAPTG